MRAVGRLVAGALIAAVAVGTLAAPAAAHPLGNFTTNVYVGLQVGTDGIAVDYVLDLAEIPALQVRDDLDDDGDDDVSTPEAATWAAAECGRLAPLIDVQVGGEAVALETARSSVSFPPGQAGLDTLRLECRLEGPLDDELVGATEVTLVDETFASRLGWREVTATGDRTTLVSSDVPSQSVSDRLTSYPEDQLSSPLDRRQAHVVARPGGPPAEQRDDTTPTAVPGVGRAADALTELVSDRRITLPFAAAGLIVAIVLGAMHAIAPGHGKTVMAAYLVGQRGSREEALVLGLTVAATHTAGVLALGIVLSTTVSFAPERLYPWLGVASGVLVAAIGIGLLVRAWRLRSMPILHHDHGLLHHHHHGWGHQHHDDHDLALATVAAPDLAVEAPADALAAHAGLPDHDHDHGHQHDHDSHGHHRDEARFGRRGIIAMGFAGGLVPSPSALVVLLGAIALGRAWFGVLVIAAYGVGMAITLVVAGLVLARLRNRLELLLTSDRPRLLAAARVLPLATAGLVLVGGVVLVARAGATF